MIRCDLAGRAPTSRRQLFIRQPMHEGWSEVGECGRISTLNLIFMRIATANLFHSKCSFCLWCSKGFDPSQVRSPSWMAADPDDGCLPGARHAQRPSTTARRASFEIEHPAIRMATMPSACALIKQPLVSDHARFQLASRRPK